MTQLAQLTKILCFLSYHCKLWFTTTWSTANGREKLSVDDTFEKFRLHWPNPSLSKKDRFTAVSYGIMMQAVIEF